MLDTSSIPTPAGADERYASAEGNELERTESPLRRAPPPQAAFSSRSFRPPVPHPNQTTAEEEQSAIHHVANSNLTSDAAGTTRGLRYTPLDSIRPRSEGEALAFTRSSTETADQTHERNVWESSHPAANATARASNLPSAFAPMMSPPQTTLLSASQSTCVRQLPPRNTGIMGPYCIGPSQWMTSAADQTIRRAYQQVAQPPVPGGSPNQWVLTPLTGVRLQVAGPNAQLGPSPAFAGYPHCVLTSGAGAERPCGNLANCNSLGTPTAGKEARLNSMPSALFGSAQAANLHLRPNPNPDLHTRELCPESQTKLVLTGPGASPGDTDTIVVLSQQPQRVISTANSNRLMEPVPRRSRESASATKASDNQSLMESRTPREGTNCDYRAAGSKSAGPSTSSSSADLPAVAKSATKETNATAARHLSGQDKGHVKRPMNAYMVWSHPVRARLLKQDPSMHNSIVSKFLGVLLISNTLCTQNERSPSKQIIFIILFCLSIYYVCT